MHCALACNAMFCAWHAFSMCVCVCMCVCMWHADEAPAPADAGPSDNGRLKWGHAETELLYRLSDSMAKTWADCNASRKEQGEADLPLPTQAQVAKALTEKLGMPSKKGTFVTKLKVCGLHTHVRSRLLSHAVLLPPLCTRGV